jgi:hypothetical protein
MAEVHGFWSEAIQAGVKALGFSIGEVAGAPWMAAAIARDDAPAAVRRAAAAAVAVDKEIAYAVKTTPTTQARTALMLRLSQSAAIVELENYQRLLAVAVLQRVAADPARMLEALAEPYE